VGNVRQNSLFERMGLRSGDVLMQVNGATVGAHTDIEVLLYPIVRGEPALAQVLRTVIPLRFSWNFSLPPPEGARVVPAERSSAATSAGGS
jgi:hypothetical protein